HDDRGRTAVTGPTLAATLAAHIVRTAARPLPAATRSATTSALLHNLTVAPAAHGLALPGTAGSRELPSAATAVSLPDPAFATSLRMGARAQHDEHPRSVTHLGSAVTPAVLAVAPRDVDGARVLSALAIGYQVGGVLGGAL